MIQQILEGSTPKSSSTERVAGDEIPLVCESCGTVADEDAEGWRAPLGPDANDHQVTVVLCPACARDVDENT
jgi:hypothetical protein